jgi:TPR repeat protein
MKFLNELNIFNIGCLIEWTKDEEEVEKDIDKAIKYYSMGAEKNDVGCMHNLYVLYFSRRENEKALEYLLLFINNSKYVETKYFFNAACLFHQYDGIKKDIKQAINYYLMAIEKGDINSMYNIALIYEQEKEIERDMDKAIKYYSMAIAKGHIDSIYNIANIFKNGYGGIEKDVDKALEYFYTGMMKKDSDCSLQFKEMISTEHVKWEPKYHIHWPNIENFNDKIILLLLISKNRKQSKKKEIQVMVKGITMLIIKYLCHFCQFDVFKELKIKNKK